MPFVKFFLPCYSDADFFSYLEASMRGKKPFKKINSKQAHK